MPGLQIFVIVLCGAVIGLALLLLGRSLSKMAKGRCCEGCVGCMHAGSCSSRDPAVDELGEKRMVHKINTEEKEGDDGDGE